MPEKITERHIKTAGSNNIVSEDDYREAVSNIRAFFDLLDRWDCGLDAVNGPGYDKLRDNSNREG